MSVLLPFDNLTAAQLRQCLDKCGKAHKGMSIEGEDGTEEQTIRQAIDRAMSENL